jgi:acyl dehydratase
MKRLTLRELERATEVDLGVSSWHEIDQGAIQLFADATGDNAWIHTDPARACDGPYGRTIAHGLLCLSILSTLVDRELITVTDLRMGLNYGTDRVRFPTPVPSGSRVRARARIQAVERTPRGLLTTVPAELEVEGGTRLAVVATFRGLYFLA